MSTKKTLSPKTSKKTPRLSPRSPRKGEDDEIVKELTPQEKHDALIKELKVNVGLLEKLAETNDVRYLSRVLRTTSRVRKTLTSNVLNELITELFMNSKTAVKSKTLLLNFTPKTQMMEIDSKTESNSKSNTSTKVKASAPPVAKKNEKTGVSSTVPVIAQRISLLSEVEVYFYFLVVVYLIDNKAVKDALTVNTALTERIAQENKRHLDLLAAKCWFYFAYIHELQGASSSIRSQLLQGYRTATLKHDIAGQAVLINMILRNYLHYNLYEQADKFISKATFPEKAANNQFARFFYYQGVIKAIQLDYTESYQCLVQAIRKAPTQSARGFRLGVTKFGVIVKLLMGDTPDRATFRQKYLYQPLEPYFVLTQAVRRGDLKEFHAVVAKHAPLFQSDKTYELILRLRHNVIKSGLRKINVSYSKISLKDVASKLNLGSVDETEAIVAKAIRDGVIDAVIDHDGSFLQSKDLVDVYSTADPQAAYHKRIGFCLDIHNEAVKSMRFPADAYKKSFETDEQRAQREKDEREVAAALAEDTDDDE